MLTLAVWPTSAAFCALPPDAKSPSSDDHPGDDDPANVTLRRGAVPPETVGKIRHARHSSTTTKRKRRRSTDRWQDPILEDEANEELALGPTWPIEHNDRCKSYSRDFLASKTRVTVGGERRITGHTAVPHAARSQPRIAASPASTERAVQTEIRGAPRGHVIFSRSRRRNFIIPRVLRSQPTRDDSPIDGAVDSADRRVSFHSVTRASFFARGRLANEHV